MENEEFEEEFNEEDMLELCDMLAEMKHEGLIDFSDDGDDVRVNLTPLGHLYGELGFIE